jgi:hypothetical protein
MAAMFSRRDMVGAGVTLNLSAPARGRNPICYRPFISWAVCFTLNDVGGKNGPVQSPIAVTSVALDRLMILLKGKHFHEPQRSSSF